MESQTCLQTSPQPQLVITNRDTNDLIHEISLVDPPQAYHALCQNPKFSGMRIRGRGENAPFVGLDLEDATFEDCHFPKADFRGAKISSAAFGCCELMESTWAWCKGSYETRFNECDLRGADFRGISRATFAFIDCDLSDVKLPSVSITLSNCTLTSASVSSADLGSITIPELAPLEQAIRASHDDVEKATNAIKALRRQWLDAAVSNVNLLKQLSPGQLLDASTSGGDLE